MNSGLSYKSQELTRQQAFLSSYPSFGEGARSGGGSLAGKTRDFVLPKSVASENLFSGFRADAEAYFSRNKIGWHRARAHLLSSQVGCLNFLAPFATQPDALREMLEPVLGPIDGMLEPEKGENRFVAFEYVGGRDYLNEWKSGKFTRGANCTSVDAAIRFRSRSGEEMLLIEWKYTESYSPPKKNDPKNKERSRRYETLAFAPYGPVRADLGTNSRICLPSQIYQLFRQQMLATQLQRDSSNGLKRVRTMLVAPKGNIALHQMKIPVFDCFGTDIVAAWQAMLNDSDSFVYCETENLFRHAQAAVTRCPELEEWARYISERYGW
jgi:hypothetical protein